MKIPSSISQRLITAAISPVVFAGALVSIPVYALQVIFSPKRAWNTALGVDDLGNATFGGELGQTVSAHAAYAQSKGKKWGCVLCKLLNVVNPGHCTRALDSLHQNLQAATQTDVDTYEATHKGTSK